MAKEEDKGPSGAYEWDVFISCRKAEKGLEYEIAHSLYIGLTDQSLRVFWEPICLPPKGLGALNKRDRELKYIKAAANSCIAVVLISRATFSGLGYDVTKYVWSSHPDELLLEWDLLLELYDRGRIQAIVPCLVGDLLNSDFIKMQDRVMAKLGLSQLDEKSITVRIREIFKFTDKDNSGFIDKAELRTTFKRFGLQISERELGALMADADDGDGGIDIFEFEDLILKLLEDKCGVVIRRKAVKLKKQAELDEGEQRLENLVKKGKEEAEGRPQARRGSDVFENGLNKRNSAASLGSANDPTSPTSKASPTSRRGSVLSQTSKEGGGVPAPKMGDNAREFFSNFWEAQIVPLLPPVLVVGAMRKVNLWLVHDLHVMVTPVLWRDAHMRAVPGLDGDGRTLEQTINCMLKFPNPHLGNRTRVAEPCIKRITDTWMECVKIRFLPRQPGARYAEAMCWVFRNKKAAFKDPITRVPFSNMLAFHRLRQIYYFDVKKCHDSIMLEDYGTRATYSGQGGNSIMLAPPISATGISFVEFNLEVIGQYPHLYLGVCDGVCDVVGGWTALSDPHSWLYAAHNGKAHHNGLSEDFGEIRPKKGDRVGLLVDMTRGTLEIYINDVSQGILASNLPRPLFFVVDFGWPTQVLEIIPKDHWQMLSQCMRRSFAGLGPLEREAKMVKMFNEIDADGSNAIDKGELNAAFEKMQVFMAEEELDDLMKAVAEEGKEEVNFEEFKVMAMSLMANQGFGKKSRRPAKATGSSVSSPVAARSTKTAGSIVSSPLAARSAKTAGSSFFSPKDSNVSSPMHDGRTSTLKWDA